MTSSGQKFSFSKTIRLYYYAFTKL